MSIQVLRSEVMVELPGDRGDAERPGEVGHAQLPLGEARSAADVFEALSDPVRVRMLWLLEAAPDGGQGRAGRAQGQRGQVTARHRGAGGPPGTEGHPAVWQGVAIDLTPQRSRIGEEIIRLALMGAALLSVAVTIGIVFSLLNAAVYLSEYASNRLRKVLKPVLEVLAGIPTVVHGFLALTIVTPILGGVFDFDGIYTNLSPGIVMGFMIVPTVASLSEDAMSAVPLALRQGSYALGANRMKTTPGGVPGGVVRDRGRDRARHLPCGRRDDDRDDRGGQQGSPDVRPA